MKKMTRFELSLSRMTGDKGKKIPKNRLAWKYFSDVRNAVDFKKRKDGVIILVPLMFTTKNRKWVVVFDYTDI
jgi:hypothetical protein